MLRGLKTRKGHDNIWYQVVRDCFNVSVSMVASLLGLLLLAWLHGMWA